MRTDLMRLLIASVVLAAVASTPARATLSIQPAYVELDLDEVRPSETLVVTNLTEQEARYRAHVKHFNYTPEGGIEQVPPDEHSLAPWTKLNPREFTLGPGQSRVIRLSVIPPDDLPAGEYWGTLEFEPLEGITARAQDDQGRSFRLEVVTSIMVPIVGQVGDVTYEFDLVGLKAWREKQGIAITARLKNTGTARLRPRGSYEVLDGSGDLVAEGQIGEDTILAGGERIFTRRVEGDFPESDYTVRVRYTASRTERTVGGQTQVAPPAPGTEGAAGDQMPAVSETSSAERPADP